MKEFWMLTDKYEIKNIIQSYNLKLNNIIKYPTNETLAYEIIKWNILDGKNKVQTELSNNISLNMENVGFDESNFPNFTFLAIGNIYE